METGVGTTPLPTPPNDAVEDHGGPPPAVATVEVEALAPIPKWVCVVGATLAATLVAGLLGAMVLAVIAMDRSTNHPRDLSPAKEALAEALMSSTKDATVVEVAGVRTAVENGLVGWLPRRIEIAQTRDGRELVATVLVQRDRDRGWLDRNGAQDACLMGNVRFGGEADIDVGWVEGCRSEPPREWQAGPNVRAKRVLDTQAALREALAGYMATHRAPYDRLALRTSLAGIVVPASDPVVLLVADGPHGDVGVGVKAEGSCLLAWLGAGGGLQVWADRVTCEPSAALSRVPLGR